MTQYRVEWVIDIDTEMGPFTAAERAREAQVRPHSTATVFTVTNMETTVPCEVDLTERTIDGEPA